MFQNIIDEDIKDEEDQVKSKKVKKVDFKKLFSISDIALYVVSFMASMVGFGTEFAPFAFAIFAATCSNRIPAGMVFIVTCIRYISWFWSK